MTSHSTLCALLTCFNRREQTLACLQCLRVSADAAGLALHAVLVDDASTDGTADAVRSHFDWVTVLSGRDLFWNRGMHMAMAHAQLHRSESLWLWLNDDTQLEPDALLRLLNTELWIRNTHGRPGIVVGATCDPVTGDWTYGGSVAGNRFRPFSFAKVHTAIDPVQCEAMNGNVVLIPREVVDDVGLLDPVFEHAMGDTDYALRSHRRGHPLYAAPGFVGKCGRNSTDGTYLDNGLPFFRRMALMLGRKGLPWRSWLALVRRHGGFSWPVYFVSPYVRVAVNSLMRRGKRS